MSIMSKCLFFLPPCSYVNAPSPHLIVPSMSPGAKEGEKPLPLDQCIWEGRRDRSICCPKWMEEEEEGAIKTSHPPQGECTAEQRGFGEKRLSKVHWKPQRLFLFLFAVKRACSYSCLVALTFDCLSDGEGAQKPDGKWAESTQKDVFLPRQPSSSVSRTISCPSPPFPLRPTDPIEID